MVDPGQFVGKAGWIARAPEWDPRLLWYSLGLVGFILIGAYAVWLTDRWRKRAKQPDVTTGDQLAHFRRLYERGEFSAEEFARIRGLLTRRLMKELEKSPPAPPEGQAPPDTPASQPPAPPAPPT